MADEQSFSTVGNRAGGRWTGKEKSDSSRGRELLRETESRFFRALRDLGSDAAYARYADEAIRLLRTDIFPVIGAGAVRRFLADTGEAGVTEQTASVEGLDVAASGDLGYTYGTVDDAVFLRIWKRNSNGSWVIVLDASIPAE
jgi:ketosteroid isomerase-like protein